MVRAEMHKNYTKQQLEDLNKDTLIGLYLSQQDQMKELDKKMQLILEQMVTSNRARFGRSSEKMPVEGQIRFAEVDGTIVFFNEAEAVADTENSDVSVEAAESGDGKNNCKPPVRAKGQKEQALSQLPSKRVDHDIPADELERLFGRDGWKRLPDEVYRRLEFIPAKVEVEEHHVAVYCELPVSFYA